MNLIAKIKQAQLTARKTRDTVATNLLTTLIGECEAVGKTAANRAPSDAEVVATVKKFIKNIDITVSALEHSTTVLDAELAILYGFLPKQLTEAELYNVISNIVAVTGADTPKYLGVVLKDLKANFDGLYDGALASRFAKDILEN